MIVAKRIKKLRTDQNIARQDFCRGIISLSHLSNIENGRYLPTEDILNCFVKKTGVPREYLVDPYIKQTKIELKLKELHSLLDKDSDECLQEIEKFEKENPYISSFSLEIECYMLKANCFIKLGKMEMAYKIYQCNVEPLIDDTILVDKNLRYLLRKFKGIFSYHIRDYDQAIKEYRMFLKEDLDMVEEAKVNFNIALCYKMKSESYPAINYAENALDFYLKSLEWDGVCKTYNLLGNLFRETKLFSEAFLYYKKALKIAEEMNFPKLKCKVLHNLGELKKNKGLYSEAIQFFNESLELKKTFKDVNLQVTYCSLIECFMHEDRLKDAKKFVTYALKQPITDFYRYQITVLKEKIPYHTGQKSQSAQYEDSLKTAIEYFESINNIYYYTLYIKELGEYYWGERKYKLAAECFKRTL